MLESQQASPSFDIFGGQSITFNINKKKKKKQKKDENEADQVEEESDDPKPTQTIWPDNEVELQKI